MPAPRRFLNDADDAIRHICEALFSGLRDYTAQTGLVLTDYPEHFELAMHPDLIATIDAAPNLFLRFQGWVEPIYGVGRRLMGIKVVADPKVDFDHPELRSTWKWVI